MKRCLCGLLLLVLAQGCNTSPPANSVRSDQTEFVFCHWNAENLFDDKNDGRHGQGDKELDPLYADNPELLKQKLGKMTDAILKMNAGKGPDILALVEIESVRAAELLQKALNDKLADKKLHYENVLMKEVSAGRHIAPAILTRLPVVKDRTRLLDRTHRTLVGHILLNDHELVVIASHWTSRLKDTSVGRRAEYADKIYGAVNAMYKTNPGVDVLISGDFNDDPHDDSVVKHLNATADASAVRGSNPPKMLNLLAGKDKKAFGTHYYKDWHLFDQIVVSPGLLDDKGWSCNPDSVQTVNDLHRPADKLKRPWRFGSANEKNERGYSDHFPVVVRLRVEK